MELQIVHTVCLKCHYYICGFTKEFIALFVWHVSGPDYESLCQIWCEPVQYWRSYRPLTNYEMGI